MSNWQPDDVAIIVDDLPVRHPRYKKYRGATCVLVQYVGIHMSDAIIACRVRAAGEKVGMEPSYLNQRASMVGEVRSARRRLVEKLGV